MSANGFGAGRPIKKDQVTEPEKVNYVACKEPDSDCLVIVVCKNDCGEYEYICWDKDCEPPCPEE